MKELNQFLRVIINDLKPSFQYRNKNNCLLANSSSSFYGGSSLSQSLTHSLSHVTLPNAHPHPQLEVFKPCYHILLQVLDFDATLSGMMGALAEIQKKGDSMLGSIRSVTEKLTFCRFSFKIILVL